MPNNFDIKNPNLKVGPINDIKFNEQQPQWDLQYTENDDTTLNNGTLTDVEVANSKLQLRKEAVSGWNYTMPSEPDSSTYAMAYGYQFQPSENFAVETLRLYNASPDTELTLTVSLWNNTTNTRLASVAVTAQPQSWGAGVITPQNLVTGTYYTVSAYVPNQLNGYKAFITNFTTTATINSRINSITPMYGSTSTDIRPTGIGTTLYIPVDIGWTVLKNTGNKILSVDMAPIGQVGKNKITWDATNLNPPSNVNVYTSVDNKSTWQTAVNGKPVQGLTSDVSTVWIREDFGSVTSTSPTINALTMSVEDIVEWDYTYTETTTADFQTGTLTNVEGYNNLLRLVKNRPISIQGWNQNGSYTSAGSSSNSILSGFEFTVNEDVTINKLMMYSINSTLSYTATIYLTNVTGASVNRSVNITMPITGAGWLSADVTPVTLTAGNKYRIYGAFGNNVNRQFAYLQSMASAVSFSKNITFNATYNQENYVNKSYAYAAMVGFGVQDLGYATSGNRVFSIDTSAYDNIEQSNISWNASNIGLGFSIETSVDNKATWQTATKGGSISGLTGDINTLWVRENLATYMDTATPFISDLTIKIKNTNVTPAQDIYTITNETIVVSDSSLAIFESSQDVNTINEETIVASDNATTSIDKLVLADQDLEVSDGSSIVVVSEYVAFGNETVEVDDTNIAVLSIEGEVYGNSNNVIVFDTPGRVDFEFSCIETTTDDFNTGTLNKVVGINDALSLVQMTNIDETITYANNQKYSTHIIKPGSTSGGTITSGHERKDYKNAGVGDVSAYYLKLNNSQIEYALDMPVSATNVTLEFDYYCYDGTLKYILDSDTVTLTSSNYWSHISIPVTAGYYPSLKFIGTSNGTTNNAGIANLRLRYNVSGTKYEKVGTRIKQIQLPSMYVTNTYISWASDDLEDSTLSIFASLDGTNWTNVTNGEALSLIVNNTTISNTTLYVRQTLNANYYQTITPNIYDFTLLVSGYNFIDEHLNSPNDITVSDDNFVVGTKNIFASEELVISDSSTIRGEYTAQSNNLIAIEENSSISGNYSFIENNIITVSEVGNVAIDFKFAEDNDVVVNDNNNFYTEKLITSQNAIAINDSTLLVQGLLSVGNEYVVVSDSNSIKKEYVITSENIVTLTDVANTSFNTNLASDTLVEIISSGNLILDVVGFANENIETNDSNNFKVERLITSDQNLEVNDSNNFYSEITVFGNDTIEVQETTIITKYSLYNFHSEQEVEVSDFGNVGFYKEAYSNLNITVNDNAKLDSSKFIKHDDWLNINDGNSFFTEKTREATSNIVASDSSDIRKHTDLASSNVIYLSDYTNRKFNLKYVETTNSDFNKGTLNKVTVADDSLKLTYINRIDTTTITDNFTTDANPFGIVLPENWSKINDAGNYVINWGSPNALVNTSISIPINISNKATTTSFSFDTVYGGNGNDTFLYVKVTYKNASGNTVTWTSPRHGSERNWSTFTFTDLWKGSQNIVISTDYVSTATMNYGLMIKLDNINLTYDVPFNGYETSGTRITSIPLSSLVNVYSNKISWNANTPTGTNFKVETSLDQSTWVQVTNGNSIGSLIEGQNVLGQTLYVKETLTTSDISKTPTLYDLTFEASTVKIINQNTIANYAAKATKTNDMTGKYGVHRTKSSNMTGKYGIHKTKSQEVTGKYVIRGVVSLANIGDYAIRNVLTQPVNVEYAIKATATRSIMIGGSYSIKRDLTQEVLTKFNIKNRIKADTEIDYSIRRNLKSIVVSDYAIKRLIEKEILAKYGIKIDLITNVNVDYNVKPTTTISATGNGKYFVVRTLTNDVNAQYYILSIDKMFGSLVKATVDNNQITLSGILDTEDIIIGIFDDEEETLC